MEDPLLFRVFAMYTVVLTTAFMILLARDRNGWWKRSELGRSLMAMSFGVWLFALIATLRQWFGAEYFGRQQFRTAAYMFIAYAITKRTVLLWRLQRRDRADHRERS